MKYNSINQIVTELDSILDEASPSALDIAGSKIVGCTIVIDGIDEFYTQYPILEEIAELGADLEKEKDQEHQQAIMMIIKQKITELKNSINN